jgi:hypothetical protein
MPFVSKAQSRLFRAKEARGELPEGTSHRWAHETPGGVKSLPETKKGAGPVSAHAASYDQGKALKDHLAVRAAMHPHNLHH